MSSSYQSRSYQKPEEQQSDANIAELIGTGLLAGAGLGGIAGIRFGRNKISRGRASKQRRDANKIKEFNKKRAANAGVVQTDLNVAPSKTVKSKKGRETIKDLIDDELTVQNLTRESRTERAKQAAAVRRVKAAKADEIIDQLRREGTVDQSATAINSGAGQQIGRTKQRLQANEDVNLARVESAEDLADAAIQQQIQKDNIPLNETPNRDAGINLASSQLPDGVPVDQAEIVATGQGSVQRKQVLENASLPSGSSSVSDLSTTNVATKPVNAQQFVAKQLSLFDPRPQSFELQDAVTNFDSKVQQLMTSAGMSRARAESLVLGDKKMTTTQGRQLKEKLEQDLLDETGAGTTTGISGRFLKSVDNIETGQKTALDREIRGRARNLDQGELPESDLRSLGSIQDSTVTEADIADVTGGIVGPSTIDLGKRATGQTLKYTGNRPANVQRIPVVEDQPVLVKRKVVNPQTGQEETENILVRGTPIQTESLPLGTRAPRGPVRTVPEGPRPNIVRTSTGLKKGEGDFVVIDGKKVQRETLTGYGPYGTETGKYISGAMDREGKYSNEAIGAVAQGPGEPLLDAGATFKDAEGKTRFLRNQPGAPQPRKPSEPLFGPNMGANERESFKGVPNKGLERIVSQGTYRSGKLSKPARAAQREQKRRTEFNYDPTKISSEDVKTSLQASEEMRRARIEGRNPQDALKTFMRNKGLM